MAGKKYQVVVIGAGASGMAAAIAALEEAEGKVLLLESNDRVGKKILATGNGKCNFTHENVSIDHYHTDDRVVLNSVLSGFPTGAALAFFERLGMCAREKNGYFYPLPETATTVLDVLRLRLAELGCEILCRIRVEKIEKKGEDFLVSFLEEGKLCHVSAGSVILAAGSKAGGFLQDKQEDPLRLAKALGLRSTALYPALTKCVCREAHYYRQLAGVRAQVKLSLYAERGEHKARKCAEKAEYGDERYVERAGYRAGQCVEKKAQGRLAERDNKTEGVRGSWELLRREAGELQLTKEGISGIAVFQLSGEIAEKLAEKRRVIVEVNFLPDFQEDDLEGWIKKRLSLLPGRSLEDFFLGVLHKKVLGVCLQAEGLRGDMRIPCVSDEITESDRIKESDEINVGRGYDAAPVSGQKEHRSAGKRAYIMIASVMKRAMHFTTEVTAVSDMKQAQVCRGGLLLSQFDEKLECRKVPGLFACGEMLNVDGECGGYNLHFAWGSGVLAGREAMRRGRGIL